MIPTVREKKEVFVTKYDTQIADKTYTVTFQDTKEKDYTIDNIKLKFKIGDKLVMLREEDRYVSDVFKVEDIYNGMYCFPYNEIEIEEVNKEFINIEDVLWYFEAKVLDPNGDEQWMKSIAEYDIFNKRMTIKEAKEYINEEVDYYTIVDVKPIYNLEFLTK